MASAVIAGMCNRIAYALEEAAKPENLERPTIPELFDQMNAGKAALLERMGQEAAFLKRMDQETKDLKEATDAARADIAMSDTFRVGRPPWEKDIVMSPEAKAAWDAMTAAEKRAATEIAQTFADGMDELIGDVKDTVDRGERLDVAPPIVVGGPKAAVKEAGPQVDTARLHKAIERGIDNGKIDPKYQTIASITAKLLDAGELPIPIGRDAWNALDAAVAEYLASRSASAAE
jgi:hypothetical protein